MIRILGPQRAAPNVADALAGVHGPVALIPAGGRHDEDEVGPLPPACERPVQHLRLYHWFDAVMQADPTLRAVYRARQDRLLVWKRAHRIRLRYALEAVRELQAAEDVDGELDAAIEHVRQIDREQLAGIAEIVSHYPHLQAPWDHHVVAGYHDEARRVLDDAAAIVIAGGQVAVLRNRLQLFGLDDMIRGFGRRIVAWSAGAMTLADRIVLFYDDPPHGPGNAEVFGDGLGLVPDVVFFPHARARLRMEPDRLDLLGRRFGGRCLGLEPGAHLAFTAEGMSDHSVADSVLELGVA